MYTKINHTNLDLVKENDVKIKNGNNDNSDDDENDTEYNEDNEYDKNNYDIYIEILIQMFCNKIRIYGDFELSSGLKNNDVPMNELPREDVRKIYNSFTDIRLNNSHFSNSISKFLIYRRNIFNRKNLISFIKNEDKSEYHNAVMSSMFNNGLLIFIYFFTKRFFYPKYSCTNSLYNDEVDKLFWINNEQKYKVEEYYDATYVLRLIHFILYDLVFIIYNSIFVITFWKIGFKIAFCILYQIIENILFISVYILIYYEDDRCVHRTNEEFIFRKNGESKTYKILAFMVIDLLNYCLK